MKNKTIEELCIEWSKKQGEFDGEKINAWRAQFIKLLLCVHDLEDAFIAGDLDDLMLEAGDCLFVLNNLKYLAQGRECDDSDSYSKKRALESALTMKYPSDTIRHYDEIVCKLWWKVFSSTKEDGRVSTSRQVLLEQSLNNKINKQEKQHG